jgi:predicted nucleotidyltransferase
MKGSELIETIYKGQLDWVKSNTIFLFLSGSHAYGTNTPESDLDYRGVCIPPKEYFYGFLNHFEQVDGNDPDYCIFDIRKFFKLAADCNPNVIEYLFVSPDNWLHSTAIWNRIYDNRYAFLSKKAKHTYTGYAHAQIKKIKSHRSWLMNPVLRKPTREDFGLPETVIIDKNQLQTAQAAIEKKLDELGGKGDNKVQQEEKYISTAESLGYDTNFIALLYKERAYRNKLNEYNQYESWKANRNPKRAEMEAKWGLDLKHCAHVVRLYRTGKELLETGEVQVRRSDAEELKAIRNGAWTYDMLLEFAEQLDKETEELYSTSMLPREPNRAYLDKLLVEIVEEFLNDK